MKRILVIGDLLTDRYRFLKPLRSDPANNAALVVEGEREEMVDGGAGNLVRNLESLCGEEVHFFYAGERFPIKIRDPLVMLVTAKKPLLEIITPQEELIF